MNTLFHWIVSSVFFLQVENFLVLLKLILLILKLR